MVITGGHGAKHQQYTYNNNSYFTLIVMCWLVICQSPCGTSSTIYRRMFPRTFFDLPRWEGPVPRKNRGSSQSGHLNQSPEMRGVGGQRGQEARVSRYTPSAEGWLDSNVDKDCCRSFLGSRVDTAAGKDGSERRGNRQVFLVCDQETPSLQCLQGFVTSFLYAPLPSQLKQTG